MLGIQVVLFLVLLAVIYHTLGKSPFGENPMRAVVAVCASLLAVSSLKAEETKVVLLPYGALAIAIPLMLVLRWLCSWRFRRRSVQERNPDRHRREQAQPGTSCDRRDLRNVGGRK